jgi:hypothetical protein
MTLASETRDDDGSCYRSKTFRNTCRDLGVRHICTRPYTPKTIGKRALHPTTLREWTPKPLRAPNRVPPSCPYGCTHTTGIGRTAALNPKRPSATSLSEHNLLSLLI